MPKLMNGERVQFAACAMGYEGAGKTPENKTFRPKVSGSLCPKPEPKIDVKR